MTAEGSEGGADLLPCFDRAAGKVLFLETALCVSNDSVIRGAASRAVPLLDLRLACAEDTDFANPIEPSVQGGRIASNSDRA